MTLAASFAVPGLLSGISKFAVLARASCCAFGMPRATLLPSGIDTNAPSSFAAVSRVRMWPNAMLKCPQSVGSRVAGGFMGFCKAYLLARTPNWGPHSLAITLDSPVTPAFAVP